MATKKSENKIEKVENNVEQSNRVVRDWSDKSTAVDVAIAELAEAFVDFKADEQFVKDNFKTLKPQLLNTLVANDRTEVIAKGKRIQIVPESQTPKKVITSVEAILALIPKKYVKTLYEQGVVKDEIAVRASHLKMTNAPQD